MSTNKRIDPAIIAAIIGVMGTVCVTLITLYATNFAPRPGQPTVPVQPTWTVAPTSTIANTPEPTTTVPVGDPTSTPAPDTPTPEPSPTPAPPPIGADWVNDCISARWRTYPDIGQPVADNGCFAGQINFPEPLNTMFVLDDRLKFRVERSFDSPQVFGLFAPLPASGTVRVDTYLRRLQDGEIWIGVFAEPHTTAQGLVAAIPPGENMRNRALIQRKMPEQVEIHRLETFSKDPNQDPPRYSVVFEFNNGEVRIQNLDDTEFNTIVLGSAQHWLFVGYQVTSGNTRIDAEFLNLLVQGP